MINSASKGQKIVLLFGLLLIFAGVLLNEWFLARFFSSDGVITSPISRTIIFLFEVVLISAGCLCIYFRRKIKPMRIAIYLGSVGVVLALAEISLQLLEKNKGYVDDIENLRLWTENPKDLGSYKMKPNLDVIYRFRDCGPVSIHIKSNSHGMRWREVSIEKPEGKERIAFMGDGLVAGSSADTIESSTVGFFDSLIDKEKYEVLNFGVFAYGPDDMELLAREEVLRFKPDYLFIMIDNANDFKDAYLGIKKYDVSSGKVLWREDTLRAKIPEELLGEPPYSTYALKKPEKREKNLTDHFRLYRYAKKWFSNNRSAPTNTVTERCRKLGQPYELDFEISRTFMSWSFWSQAQYPTIAISAKDAVLSYLRKIKNLCDDNKIKLFLVSIPFEQQIYARELRGVDRNGIEFDVSYPQKYVEDFAVKNDVPYLDLLPPLRAHAKQGGKIYATTHSDQHFGKEGREFIGKLLIEFFDNNK